MKKVIMIMAVALLAMSCEKEVTPCNCGEIMSDNAADYSVDIKNDCSGNFKTFILTPDDWMNAYVGINYCITNTTSW
jgi:ABC-type transporter MlaC component